MGPKGMQIEFHMAITPFQRQCQMALKMLFLLLLDQATGIPQLLKWSGKQDCILL